MLELSDSATGKLARTLSAEDRLAAVLAAVEDRTLVDAVLRVGPSIVARFHRAPGGWKELPTTRKDLDDTARALLSAAEPAVMRALSHLTDRKTQVITLVENLTDQCQGFARDAFGDAVGPRGGFGVGVDVLMTAERRASRFGFTLPPAKLPALANGAIQVLVFCALGATRLSIEPLQRPSLGSA